MPNINYVMNMTKSFLDREIDPICYWLDFPYEIEKRYQKMVKQDKDYAELIYDCLSKKEPIGMTICLMLSSLSLSVNSTSTYWMLQHYLLHRLRVFSPSISQPLTSILPSPHASTHGTYQKKKPRRVSLG